MSIFLWRSSLWRRFFRAILLLTNLSLASLVFPLYAQADNNPQTDSHVTLLVLGDSLSAAYGIDYQQGWVQLLAKQLAERDPAFHVINASVSGETTGGGIERLPKLLEKYHPKIVLIELGANDGLRGMPIKNLRKNLRLLVNISKQAGAQVLLLDMRIPPNYGKIYTDSFAESFSLIAKETKIELMPFFLDGIAINPEFMQADRLHPNVAAQPLILQKVLPYLQPLLLQAE